jgi:probable HAF family extracellular repeat protein
MFARLSLFASIVLLLSSLVTAQSYTVTSLGLAAGGSGALAINNLGEIAGFSTVSGGTQHAIFWTSADGSRDLGTLPGDNYSYAQGVNDFHEVAGWSLNNITGHQRAFVWKEKLGMLDLGTLGGSYSLAYGINNVHQVVGGAALHGDHSEHAFLWTQGKRMQDLGTLGGSASVASAINDSGEVVGSSYLADNVTIHAFLWTSSGGMQDLGTLGGPTSSATGISSSGQVVGASSTTSSTYGVAFLWTKAKGMQSLGAGEGSVAVGINSSYQIVGYLGIGEQDAFVWTKALGVQNLRSILVPNSAAQAVNKSGQIAATNLTLGAVLLTPVQ